MKELISKITKNNWLVLCLFFLLTLILYCNTLNGRFVHDAVSWLLGYDLGFATVMERLPTQGLLPFYHIFTWLMYKLFGINTIAWLLVFAMFHAFVALTVYRLVLTILRPIIDNPTTVLIAFVAGLMFLVCPYHAEVVVWGATIHYLISTLCILWVLLFTLRYLHTKSTWALVLVHALAFCSWFTLELGLVVPVMLALLLWVQPAYWFAGVSIRKTAIKLLAPQVLLLAAYFLINKLIIGVFFGHYGGRPVASLDLAYITGNYMKYFMKYSIFTHFLYPADKDNIYGFFELPLVAWICLSVLVLGSLTLLILSRRFSDKGKWLLLLFLFFSVALLPVLNLFFVRDHTIENDRYGYLASAFLYPFMAIAFISMFRWVGYLPLLVYLGFELLFLTRTCHDMGTAGDIRVALINDFRWYDKKEVYVITAPDNYRGWYIFRGYDPLIFENIQLYKGIDLSGSIREVSLMNMGRNTDSSGVSVANDSTISIWIGQGGEYFLREGKGLLSYETADYKVQVGDYHFDLILKHQNPEAVYIYSVGDKWKELVFPPVTGLAK
jgi:hypothetical protein